MLDSSPAVIGLLVATFFAAGLVKCAAGMGLPTLSMGILGALLSPVTAAALLIVPSFVTNVWQLLAGPSFRPLLARLGLMMAAVVAGTAVGISFLTGGDTALTTTALGMTLILYACTTLLVRQLRVSARLEPWLSPVVGVVTGVVAGATGVFVIPAVPYIQSLDFERDELVQALGLSFTISTIALAGGLALRGAFHVENLALSAAATVPALAGMWAGQAVRRRVSPETFRRGFLIVLLILGVEMVARSLH